MDALLRQSSTVAYIADQLRDDLFTVIDVGCGGGHMPAWRALGPRLRAFGFDPQRFEIARLREAETNPLCEYIEGYVGAPAGHPLRTLHGYDVYWSRSCWRRLAPARSRALADGGPLPDFMAFDEFADDGLDLGLPEIGYPRPLRKREPQPPKPSEHSDTSAEEVRVDRADAERQLGLQQANRWYEADLADKDRQIDLPQFLDDRGVDDIDFLKIDVDGPDYEILYTMSEKLTDAQVLGVSLEVNFNGSHQPHHHTFHNMDRFMRAHGFALFALTVRTYSSAALPQPYVMPHPAQSIRGRPLQGDALYMRDFGLKHPGSDAEQVSDEKLAKTAILFAMFDLPAEAAEHLLRFRQRLARMFDVDKALDLLAAESQRDERTEWSYADYMAAFEAGDGFFLNRQLAPAWDPATGQGSHPIIIAQTLAREAQAQAAAAQAEAEALKAELETLRLQAANPARRRSGFRLFSR